MFINKESCNHSISLLCEVLEIKRSTYYKYKNKVDSDYNDYLIIKKVFNDSKQTYGYRRVTIALQRKLGLVISEKKVRRIMRKYNIKPNYVKKYKVLCIGRLVKKSSTVLQWHI